MSIKIVTTNNYKYGQIDTLEARSIPRGAATASLNWLTKGDHIELRRGQAYLGTTSVNTGTGKATGLKKATNALGVEILFGTYGKKLKYYDETTDEWIENGSDLLGSAVIDSAGLGLELIAMSEYVGLAGNQLFLNSPNCAGYYKIMVANPGSSTNMYDAAKNFKGSIKVDTNRTLLWARAKDQTGLYGSRIDTQTYTTVASEATTSLSGTLAFKGGGTTRTCFGVAIVLDGTSEAYTDDYAGTLTGSLGGTGTINYTSGAYTLSNAGTGIASYQWEDSNVHGVTDFTKSGTRLAGEGFIFRQDEGGGSLKAVPAYSQVYYCMHIKKTWVLSIGSDDTTATNLPYRQNVGIPNERASVETGEGIYYIDDVNQNDVRVRLLTYSTGGSNQVIPVAVSKNINLNDYRFDQAASVQYGDLILFACATNDSTQTIDGLTSAVNNRVLVYNKLWKSWDILDYGVTCFEIYNGTLIGGDSLSNNFITLFSGFDDFDNTYPNYWIGDDGNLDMDGLKKSKKFYLEGLIAPDQVLEIYASVDSGAFNFIGSVNGKGSYVDQSNSVNIGAQMLGSKEIGGGGDGLSAYHYERLFSINTDKLERISLMYVCTGIGYCSVSTQKYWDVRFKGVKVPSKYRN